jgi:hypothetical protein
LNEIAVAALPYISEVTPMLPVLLIVIVLILLLGGGGAYGRRAGWGPRGYGLGLVLTILIILALVWSLNELLLPPLPMPAGTPSIMK